MSKNPTDITAFQLNINSVDFSEALQYLLDEQLMLFVVE